MILLFAFMTTGTFAPKTTGGKLNASGSKFLNRRKRQELEPGRTDDSNSAAQTRDPHGAMGLLSSSDLEPIVPQTVPVVSSAPLQQLPSSSQGLSFNDLSRIAQEISPRTNASPPPTLTSNYASSSPFTSFDFAPSSQPSDSKFNSSSRVRIEDDVESVEESAIRPAVRQPSNHDAAAGGGRKKKVLFQADVQDNRPDSSQSSNFDDLINIEPTISDRTYRRLPTSQLLDETTIGTRVTPDMDDNALVDAFRKEIDELRCERDLLLDEKRAWLEQLKNENAVMMLLLQDSKTAKERLLQELDLVEKEKDKLRSREMDEIDARFDELLSSTPLGEQSRANLPPALRSKADEVHKQLCMQAIRCRSNQRDLSRFILDRVSVAEQAFMQSNSQTVQAITWQMILEELRSIASVAPCNVASAKEVAKDLFLAVSMSALEGISLPLIEGNVEAKPIVAMASLQKHILKLKHEYESQKRLGDTRLTSKKASRDATEHTKFLAIEKSKIKVEYDDVLSEAIALKIAAEKAVGKLTAKNEALKNNLTNLRKKGTSSENLDATGAVLNPNNPILAAAVVVSSFDDLPSTVRAIAWRELTVHCRTIVTSHLLAA